MKPMRVQMTRRNLLVDASLLMAVWYLLLPSPALAYWDVNTGTYIVQLIMGLGVAFWMSFKHSFIMKWFKRGEKPSVTTSAVTTSVTAAGSAPTATLLEPAQSPKPADEA